MTDKNNRARRAGADRWDSLLFVALVLMWAWRLSR
jgi:hypothetical protein